MIVLHAHIRLHGLINKAQGNFTFCCLLKCQFLFYKILCHVIGRYTQKYRDRSPTGVLTHLLNVAGDKYDVDTTSTQLVEDQEGVDHVTVTQETLCDGQSVPETN